MCRQYHGTSPVFLWRLTVEAQIRFRISRCKVCSVRSGIRTGFMLNASVLTCQYQSTPSKPSFTYVLPLT